MVDRGHLMEKDDTHQLSLALALALPLDGSENSLTSLP